MRERWSFRRIATVAAMCAALVAAPAYGWAEEAASPLDAEPAVETVAPGGPETPLEGEGAESSDVTETAPEPEAPAPSGTVQAPVDPSTVFTDPDPGPVPPERLLPTVSARAHVQSVGWFDVSGTSGASGLVGQTGKSRRLEAFALSLVQPAQEGLTPLSGSIRYRSYVAGAWQAFVADGAVSGTQGLSRSVEAVSIELTDELAAAYDVYYRVHCQGFGWMGWTSNGQTAGSIGFGRRAEALEVRLVKKGETPSLPAGNTADPVRRQLVASVRAHVQSYGWRGAVTSGWAGTTGQSKRLEALQVQVQGLESGGGIEYRAHVQGIGWTGWVSNGQTAGTVGQGRRLEAVQIRLTGAAKDAYSVYYRVHSARLGTLGWACDGDQAGTTGLALRAEAVEVCIVPKGTGPATGGALVTRPSLVTSAQVAGLGWRSATEGVCGTTGQARELQRMKMTVSGSDRPAGTVQYRLHVAGTGWTGWYNEGQEAGTGKRIEAVQVRLTGQMANLFDVYYRGHVQGIGWLDWARNGASAGSTGIGRRMEAVQVVLRAKGSGAPGSTTRPLVTTLAPTDPMGRRAWGQSSATRYLLMVDVDSRRVGVYQGSRNNWSRIKYYTVSVGAPSSPTVRGTFQVGSRGYSFGSGYTCYYWTQFYGDYLFHSVKYYQGTRTIMDGRLGQAVSHGCVRMNIDEAKWIYDNIPTGSRVVVY